MSWGWDKFGAEIEKERKRALRRHLIALIVWGLVVVLVGGGAIITAFIIGIQLLTGGL